MPVDTFFGRKFYRVDIRNGRIETGFAGGFGQQRHVGFVFGNPVSIRVAHGREQQRRIESGVLFAQIPKLPHQRFIDRVKLTRFVQVIGQQVRILHHRCFGQAGGRVGIELNQFHTFIGHCQIETAIQMNVPVVVPRQPNQFDQVFGDAQFGKTVLVDHVLRSRYIEIKQFASRLVVGINIGFRHHHYLVGEVRKGIGAKHPVPPNVTQLRIGRGGQGFKLNVGHKIENYEENPPLRPRPKNPPRPLEGRFVTTRERLTSCPIWPERA